MTHIAAPTPSSSRDLVGATVAPRSTKAAAARTQTEAPPRVMKPREPELRRDREEAFFEHAQTPEIEARPSGNAFRILRELPGVANGFRGSVFEPGASCSSRRASSIAHYVLAGLLFAPGAFAQEAFQVGSLEAERAVVHQGGYFPRLAMLPSGDLLAFFKTGAAHIGKGGRASMSRSADGGKTWSEPVTVFDRPNADDGIVASGIARDGSVMVAAVSYTWNGDRYTTEGWIARTWFQRSGDGGRTWSTPVEVNVKPLGWAYPFGHILEEADGTLLLAGYGGPLPITPERPQASFVVRSRDGGKTWGDLVQIAPGHNEITMAKRRDGSILAVMRTVAGARLNSSISRDGGRTWSAPKQVTEDREHPADLLRLSNGDLLLTFGQRNKPFGVQAMRSRDDGATWERDSRVVLAFDGDHSDLGYPVTIERRDGRLVTVYYIVYGERDSEGLKGIAPKNAFTKAIIWSPPRSWKR